MYEYLTPIDFFSKKTPFIHTKSFLKNTKRRMIQDHGFYGFFEFQLTISESMYLPRKRCRPHMARYIILECLEKNSKHT